MGAGTQLAAYGMAIGTGNFAAAAVMLVNDTMSFITNSARLRMSNTVERESLALSRDRAGVAFNYSRMGGAK